MADAKESLCVVLDVGETFRPHLSSAIEAVRMLINAKILFHPRDVVGIALHGTAATRNALADEQGDGEYPNISEVHPMAPVSHKTLVALESARTEAPGDPADLVDSLCLGMYAVIQHVGKLKWAKRVLIITDGLSPATVDEEQLEQIASQLRDSKIRFEVFGVGIDASAVATASEDEAAAAATDDDDDPRARTALVLRSLQAAVGADFFSFTPMSDAMSMVAALRKKAVRSSTAFRGPLEIGASVGLPLWSWRKVSPAGAPKMANVSKAALAEAEAAEEGFDPSGTVKSERRYFLQTEPDDDVPPNMSVPGYRFGKDLVPVAGADADGIKLGLPSKTLQLLGLLPMAELPRHLLTTKAECVVADPDAGDGCGKAAQALMLALEENELVAIARHASRKGAAPKLVALWPAIRSFWMAGVPFADELRTFDWGPPPAAPPPTRAQAAAASDLVDALELCPPAMGREGGGGEAAAEPLLPKHIFSPKLQRYYQCIQARALASITAPTGPSGATDGADGGGAAASTPNLPPVDPRVTRAFAMDEGLLAAARPALDAFAAACPISGGATAATGSKRSRQALPTEQHDQMAAADAAASLDKRPRATAGGDAALLQLTCGAEAVRSIDTSGDAVRQFWEMLGYEDEDRTSKAVGGMASAIASMLETAQPADAYAERALKCLRELRRGAVMHDEPAAFNDHLRALKATYASGPKAWVWAQIVADAALAPGLITAEEGGGESEVTAGQAAAFWTAAAPIEEAPSTAAAAPPASGGDDFDIDDMD